MPLEREGFRDQLERLDKLFAGREAVNIMEACAVTGLDRRTLLADKTFPARKVGAKKKYGGKWMVGKVLLARWMVAT